MNNQFIGTFAPDKPVSQRGTTAHGANQFICGFRQLMIY